MQAKKPARPRIQRELKFQSFCYALRKALDQEQPGWVRHFNHEDLKRWAAELWPIPPLASLNIRTWARCCYRHLAKGEDHRLAS